MISELELLKKEIKEIKNTNDTNDLIKEMKLLKLENKKLKDELDKIGNFENGIEDYLTKTKNLAEKKELKDNINKILIKNKFWDSKKFLLNTKSEPILLNKRRKINTEKINEEAKFVVLNDSDMDVE